MSIDSLNVHSWGWHPSFCTTPVSKSVFSDVECNEFMVCWFLNLKEHHAWNSEGIEMRESAGGPSEKFWTYCKERSWWWRNGRGFMLITIHSHVETLVSVEQLFLHYFWVMLFLLKLMICCLFNLNLRSNLEGIEIQESIENFDCRERDDVDRLPHLMCISGWQSPPFSTIVFSHFFSWC